MLGVERRSREVGVPSMDHHGRRLPWQRRRRRFRNAVSVTSARSGFDHEPLHGAVPEGREDAAHAAVVAAADVCPLDKDLRHRRAADFGPERGPEGRRDGVDVEHRGLEASRFQGCKRRAAVAAPGGAEDDDVGRVDGGLQLLAGGRPSSRRTWHGGCGLGLGGRVVELHARQLQLG